MRLILLTFLAVLGLRTSAQAPIITLQDPGSTGFIGRQFEILEDTSASMDLDQARNATGFRQGKTAVPNFGLTASAFWVRFDLVNAGSTSEFFLNVPHPEVEEIDVHFIRPDGSITHEKSGQLVDLDLLPFKDNDYIIPFHLGPHERVSIYLRTTSGKQLQLPLSILSSASFASERSTRDTVVGLYLGVLLVLLLYNLFVYLSIKERSYLIYVLYLTAVLCTQATFLGLGKYYLWPSSDWMARNGSMLFTVLTAITACEFMTSFLQLRTDAPRLARIPYVFYGLLVIGLIVKIGPASLIGYNVLQGLATLLALYQLFVGVRMQRNGSRPARYFMLAWCVFLLGVVVFVLKDFNILPYNNITKYTMPFGSAIEGLLLSFGLADKINILRREKERSQAEALRISMENEKIIRDQNVVLEQKVTERTQELRESNEHLKRTQSQLVNSEKMASIGQLTAGIAHEINNPVNFISSNIPPLRRNISEMMEVLQRYRTINAGSTVPEISELRETEDQLGIDDSISETTEILNSIENGAGRTAEIVRGLRNFSRLDEGDLKAADVNEGLRSTLAVLSPHVRDKVKIDLDLGGLPAIECYPGKLNQVFMNILTNAAQACKTVHPEGGGLITVRTRTEGEHVEVLITDNGPGFTAEVKNRMFEPFYTTKGVGEGTGLGLSIAYGIIEKHEGSIDAESAPGEGATFRILLPIQRQPNAKRA